MGIPDPRGGTRVSRARIRVLHLGPDPAGPGGMPAVVRGLLASPLSEHYDQSAVATYRVVAPWRRHLLFVAAVARTALWCVRPGPRLLHIHTAVRGSLYRKAVLVALGRVLRRPVVLHLHAGAGDIAAFATRLGPLRRFAFRRTFALADRVLSVSRAGAAEIERRFGARAVRVVPNAAPRVGAAAPIPARQAATVLYLGGFDDPAKGGDVLVRSLPALLERVPGVRVQLAGPGAAPPALAPLSERHAGVRWLGWLDEAAKATAFRDADVVVLPSITEGLPVALLEAMAYGRAIVATRAGGLPEVLTDARDALLVPAGDPGALAEALIALVHDPERRAGLGAAARAQAERLNSEAVYRPLRDIYAQLAGAGGARRRAVRAG